MRVNIEREVCFFCSGELTWLFIGSDFLTVCNARISEFYSFSWCLCVCVCICIFSVIYKHTCVHILTQTYIIYALLECCNRLERNPAAMYMCSVVHGRTKVCLIFKHIIKLMAYGHIMALSIYNKCFQAVWPQVHTHSAPYTPFGPLAQISYNKYLNFSVCSWKRN